ncbi:MAG: hypothetical protein PHI68_08850 [Candidatus Cloacimonetes bacterium]|nr:hypothetical protein [Candidatus Cloacimonadota bacterium]
MAYRPSAGRNQKGSSAPEEANLVPIMNVFLTIIPFLLMMIVVGQVALLALNFEGSASGGGGEGEGSGGGGDERNIEVIIVVKAQPNPGFLVKVTYDGKDIEDYPKTYANFRELDQGLKDLRNHPTRGQVLKDVTDIGILPEADVLYGVLLQTIDVSKTNGFSGVRYQEYFEGII